MEKRNKYTGIIDLFIMLVLSFVVVIGSAFIIKYTDKASTTSQTTDSFSSSIIDITAYNNTNNPQIKSASKLLSTDGDVIRYAVTVATKGLQGDILMEVTFDESASQIISLNILKQIESEGYGARITEGDFINQFSGIQAPLYLDGRPSSSNSNNTNKSSTSESSSTKEASTIEVTSSTVWTDGTYLAEASEYDQTNFINTVSITILDGKITEIVWDAYNEAGEFKSVMSADGLYVMTEDGLTWHEQALALAKYVIEQQSVDAIAMDENSNTDSVSGVSITVNEFINLAEDCLSQASPRTTSSTSTEDTNTEDTSTEDTNAEDTSTDGTSTDGTRIDGITGATISSQAVVDGINAAQTFLQDFVLNK